MTRSSLNRRQFMGRSLAAAGVGAGFAIGGTKSSGRIIGANETVRIAVAGLNGRGGAHVSEFAAMPGVEIVYLVDPDSRTYAKRLKQVEAIDEEGRQVRRVGRRPPRRTSAASWRTRRSTPSRSPRPTTGTR